MDKIINPCKECICLPTCISIYKKCNNKILISYKFSNLYEKCDLLYKTMFDIFGYFIDGSGNIYYFIKTWWKYNYGE